MSQTDDHLQDLADLATGALDLLREVAHEERSTRGRTARYARARRRLARAIGGSIRGVQSGALSVPDATGRFAAAYERAALEAAIGSYARARATPDALLFAAVEAEVDTTSRRFGHFMADVRADAVGFPGGARARADLYLRRLDGFRNRTWADAASGPGATWWWELGASDHCRDCLSLHLESPFRERPPTVPRMGGTVCQTSCGCVLTVTIGGREPGSR